MKKIKSWLLRIYHVKALKYIVVTVVGFIVIGFVDENSVWHHIVNRQRISELQDEIDRYTQHYFMKADDEDIFVLSDDPKNGKSILNDETVE